MVGRNKPSEMDAAPWDWMGLGLGLKQNFSSNISHRMSIFEQISFNGGPKIRVDGKKPVKIKTKGQK